MDVEEIIKRNTDVTSYLLGQMSNGKTKKDLVDYIIYRLSTDDHLNKPMIKEPNTVRIAEWNIGRLGASYDLNELMWVDIFSELISNGVDIMVFQGIPLVINYFESSTTMNYLLRIQLSKYLKDVDGQSGLWDIIVSDAYSKGDDDKPIAHVIIYKKKYEVLDSINGVAGIMQKLNVDFSKTKLDNAKYLSPLMVVFNDIEKNSVFSLTSFDTAAAGDIKDQMDTPSMLERRSLIDIMHYIRAKSNDFYPRIKYHVSAGGFNSNSEQLMTEITERLKTNRAIIMASESKYHADFFVIFADGAKLPLSIDASEIKVEWKAVNLTAKPPPIKPLVYRYSIKESALDNEGNDASIFITSTLPARVLDICKRYNLSNAYHFIDTKETPDKALILKAFSQFKKDDNDVMKNDLTWVLRNTKSLFVQHKLSDVYEQCLKCVEKLD